MFSLVEKQKAMELELQREEAEEGEQQPDTASKKKSTRRKSFGKKSTVPEVYSSFQELSSDPLEHTSGEDDPTPSAVVHKLLKIHPMHRLTASQVLEQHYFRSENFT
jgi:hypothetical protein